MCCLLIEPPSVLLTFFLACPQSRNSPKELMSLLCFLMPLFSRKNSDMYSDQNENDGGENMLQHFVNLESTSKNNDTEDSHAKAYSKLKQLFAPFVLRRRKCDVLNQILPPKVSKCATTLTSPKLSCAVFLSFHVVLCSDLPGRTCQTGYPCPDTL